MKTLSLFLKYLAIGLLTVAFINILDLSYRHFYPKPPRITIFQEVQLGTSILRCELPEGSRNITPLKVAGYEKGVWTFTDGTTSNNCVLFTQSTKQHN